MESCLDAPFLSAWWTRWSLCVCCSEPSTVGAFGPLRTVEQRRQVTFTSVWWVLLVCLVCAIFLHGRANTTPLDIRCNAFVCVWVWVWVCVCVAKGARRVEESQAALRKLCLSIIRGGNQIMKLWSYFCLRKLVVHAIISFRQIWKDPLEISIKPNKKHLPSVTVC